MKLQIDNLGKVAITVDNNYWDINKDYDKLVIVEVKDKFSTYLSRKPVPSGTEITNREYWIPFSSLRENIILDYNAFVKEYGDIIKTVKEQNTKILNGLDADSLITLEDVQTTDVTIYSEGEEPDVIKIVQLKKDFPTYDIYYGEYVGVFEEI